ncbi:helix-turn-helix domain-containing protein [Danxiaibacter flavus]|uniref:Helix-turn-helix domain-containing protein n=1 Tax=Danxiaibacter flavus TaxID=3049108 RepID=A0ABV3ZIL5_9BACT|nr:helix-turn-helix domain-containing protein [Chitinophagaceae bacterium DXS]
MVGQSFLPGPALREYVKGYQLWHFTFPDANDLPFKPYAPRPEQTLIFCPRGVEQVTHAGSDKIIRRTRSFIMGQFTERTNRYMGSTDYVVLLVTFQPGVLYRITGIPYAELTNTFVDAEAVFSKEMRLVNERLNSTDDPLEMIRIVESFLCFLLRDIKRDMHPLDAVVNLLLERPENFKLLHLARESFLCTRQFERIFKERMGINPKLFSRIARAYKAYRIKYQHPELDWLGIALFCGYQDYQHLVKDFQDFAGVPPNLYLLEDSKAPERLLGVRDLSILKDVVFLPLNSTKSVSIL